MTHNATFQFGTPTGDMTTGPRERLGEALVIKQLITREQLDEALHYQSEKGHKKLLGELLV